MSARLVMRSADSVTCRLARVTTSPRRCRQKRGNVSSSYNGLTCFEAFRDSERLVAEQLGHQTCGLALEHLLQMTYRPVMMAR